MPSVTDEEIDALEANDLTITRLHSVRHDLDRIIRAGLFGPIRRFRKCLS